MGSAPLCKAVTLTSTMAVLATSNVTDVIVAKVTVNVAVSEALPRRSRSTVGCSEMMDGTMNEGKLMQKGK